MLASAGFLASRRLPLFPGRTMPLFPPAVPRRTFLWRSHEAAKPIRSKVISAFTNLIGWGLVGSAIVAVYNRYKSKKERLAQSEPIPDNKHIKADLPLVLYRGCVVPRFMLETPVLAQIEAFELRDSDVIVASYPKSGTTWLQEVVYRLCHLRGEEDHYPGAVMETKFPYLEFAYPGLKDVSERKGRRFIKTHLPTQLLPESLARSKAKVLYISRNPKDVCVSYFHFAKMLRYIDFRGDFGKFVRQLFIADRAPYSPFFPHLRGYKSLSESDPSRCLFLRYEDMKEDPQREIGKVARFLGMGDLTEEESASVSAATSFEAMRANPLTNYSHWDEWGLRTSKKGRVAEFFRRGEVGDYRNHQLDRWTRESFDQWVESGVKATGLQFKYEATSTTPPRESPTAAREEISRTVVADT